MVAVFLGGCLEWEEAADVDPGEPEVPALHVVTPSSLPPVASFDPGDPTGRCRIACARYHECFGVQVDPASCEYTCLAELWVADENDLACFIWSACSQLWLCYD